MHLPPTRRHNEINLVVKKLLKENHCGSPKRKFDRYLSGDILHNFLLVENGKAHSVYVFYTKLRNTLKHLIDNAFVYIYHLWN